METPPTGISVQLADESDVYKWKVSMKGPEGTPYQVRSFAPTLKGANEYILTHLPN
jgi:ubiquitin-conjugating enzyme E2 D/E